MKQFKFNERQRFSIRKFSIGAASVLLGSVFFAVSSVEDVQAAEQSQNVVSVNENKQTPNPLMPSNSSTTGVSTKEANTSVSAANVENKPKGDVAGSSQNPQELEPVVSTISDSNERKLALSKLIEEIDGKFTNGKYASKTEESVNQLKATLEEARSVLSNATTESELTQAHSKLVTATTKLQTKPTEKKQAPAVDTTNGKATVGKKATNTEKASESNSIANSGSRDERHGKALDRSNPFRTDGATTDTDPSANQTYTLPGDSASVAELANSLKGLDSSISNETKLASIDEVGRLKNVQAGEVKEIDEFGGWSAVSADGKKGKFAIARKTNEGVFPIETVNVTRAGYTYTAHVEENSFDRSHEYALFLSKVRTNATKSEETFDGQPFKDIGEGRQIAKGLKGFNGIEKTYKAYSSSTGTGVNISFKTGFTGDIDGFKAGYKVEVIAKFEDGHTQSIYNQSFRPDQSINDTNKQVTSVDANDSIRFTVGRPPEPTIDVLNQKLAGYKNRQGNRTGSFTSKNIDLPKGAVEYTVRISASDNSRLGMGYQTTWSQYALPVSGLGFSITQDTNRVARTLLERVYNKLLDTRDADKRGKTPESQKAYQDQLDAIKALLDGTLQPTDAYKKILTNTLEAQNALKVDKSALTTSTGKLEQLVDDDPTPGKTPETVSEYNIAKNAAEEEARKAKLIIDDEHATVDQVAQAVADVKAKRAELKAARAELVVAATDAQKTKLQNDSNALTEADKTGKTPKSIAEYEVKYETLKTALTAAKAQAKAVLDKTVNAGKVEATDAQIEVDKIKAELDKAAALLKDKGNTAELEKAKNDLKTLTQETNVTAGKTQATADKYNAAKTAAEAAVTAAEGVISDINSTTEDVANALAEIKVKKAELEAAKKNLVPAATEAQKAKLEADATKLVKASTDGKTQDSVNAYETAYTNLTAELEAAKAKAAAVKAAGDNASRLEALAAQEAVDAVLAKLESAKATLVDKATDDQVAELRKADTALTPAEGSTFEATKTPASIAAYKDAVNAIQTQLTEAKTTAADLVTKAGQNNATKAEAAAAIAKVEALKAKLVDATALLKDKANTGDLATAKDELKALAGVANVTDGKTTSTTEAYDAAKQAADAAVTAAEGIINNADSTPEEVATALTNVKAKKAELEKAKAALVDKATEAQKAKLEADAAKLTKADTTGKTQDSIDAYNEKYTQLTTELEEAKAKAAAVKAAGDNASRLEALAAQEAVDAVQAKLDAAKATLVDKATEEQVAELRKAEAALTPAEESTLAGTKTPASIAEYKKAVEAIQADLTQAKTTAADLVTKAEQNNATKAEAAAAIAKVEELKAKLVDATALLKDKANTGDLATAKDELKALAGVANVTDGKTTSTTEAYDAAKQAADAAVTAAEGIINNADSTPEEVATALTNVKAKKAELEKAKAALVDKATEAQKTKLEADAAKLVKADTAGKTQDSINAYETTYNNLKTELDKAIEAAATIKTAGDNA
ncbi:YSIRK-type signal peptide-containing protein, partial [Streptococcus sp. 5346]|uniref:YSIRK-type signal peptide-containing protein n=1 Tax=Streptococcus sp. 5346 TaxID=2582636 RepID=UPI0015650AAB